MLQHHGLRRYFTTVREIKTAEDGTPGYQEVFSVATTLSQLRYGDEGDVNSIMMVGMLNSQRNSNRQAISAKPY
jgi:hypothetical protein